MIDKLAELNRVMLAVRSLRDTNGVADLAAVIEHCKSTVIEARMPKHEMSLRFAEQAGLLISRGSELSLTEGGLSFIEMNDEGLYDLSSDQKRFLLRTCYLHGPFRKEVRAIFTEFSQSLGGDTLRWSFYDSSPLPNEWSVDHLNQLGLLRRREDGWEVCSEYTKTVAVFLEEGEGWSEEKFREYLKEKEEVGQVGEDLVKDYEARRLARQGHVVESRCVRRISALRVNAGYDIESFDGSSPTVNYDRFIEVKSARGPHLRFFWSQNELQVATKLGDRYWIYFQGGIDITARVARHEPIILQNPVESVLNSKQFTTVPQGLIVEAKMTGRPVGRK